MSPFAMPNAVVYCFVFIFVSLSKAYTSLPLARAKMLICFPFPTRGAPNRGEKQGEVSSGQGFREEWMLELNAEKLKRAGTGGGGRGTSRGHSRDRSG